MTRDRTMRHNTMTSGRRPVRAWLAFGLLALSTAAATLDAAESESGFVPIFDGKTLDGWDGNPKFWRVEEGAITGQTTADNPTDGNTFLVWRQGVVDDFELELQYRIVGGNSGIQYRSFEKPKEWGRWVIGGYQADLEAGDNWSGTLYAERERGVLAKRGQKTIVGDDHKPKLVGSFGDPAALQALIRSEDWNDYHISARGNRFVHKINGRVMAEVTDDDASMRRAVGLLALQLHAGPPMMVQFRNIRLKRLPLDNAKKVVLVAGRPSHAFGAHEHNAGCALLADALNAADVGVRTVLYRNGWPSDPTAFDNADAVVLYMDGGSRHPVNGHLESFQEVMKRPVGLACIHYAVEVPKGASGKRFLDWIGGYFEAYWSVNPHWTANFKKLPEHPITRGVAPFEINDEWYYHMRFPPGMEGVTPILTAVPPDATRERNFGTAHGGNPTVVARRGKPEHVAWTFDRPGGGRGFGFTGGHVHWNWANDDFRKLVLNAIAWTAEAEVPSTGVPSKTPTRDQLEKNMDPKPRPKS